MAQKNEVRKHEQAVRNIRNLRTVRMNHGLSLRELSEKSGISVSNLKDYESGRYLPLVKSYNQLSEVFGWQKLPESSLSVHKRVRILSPRVVIDEWMTPALVEVPLLKRYEFTEGHQYEILETETGRGESVKDSVFRYEGKHGIHHFFREVRGNWTRTYTDEQLIGKKVQEVEI